MKFGIEMTDKQLDEWCYTIYRKVVIGWQLDGIDLDFESTNQFDYDMNTQNYNFQSIANSRRLIHGLSRYFDRSSHSGKTMSIVTGRPLLEIYKYTYYLFDYTILMCYNWKLKHLKHNYAQYSRYTPSHRSILDFSLEYDFSRHYYTYEHTPR
ncbi:unnamed protein product [Didymodactylos carnosus]|uniref:Endo-beta-N-acetylglucosaminidase EndoS/F2-like TIM-barrel domain-containing protein n=1 Tax=Didymodactylos carnosus TaxID=1234261 RepID=A0A814UVG2_9BILA|nr:unnamed protein product [Didymodactylos carnosus]CAF1413330.1 unnamed protein product [Didymodactylos carnosus]CAF3944491.1 unnamed protein product [Didymodactylos carnosus]CAF4216514.1 unnamed protein product [Didymodactylos carnosus]